MNDARKLQMLRFCSKFQKLKNLSNRDFLRLKVRTFVFFSPPLMILQPLLGSGSIGDDDIWYHRIRENAPSFVVS